MKVFIKFSWTDFIVYEKKTFVNMEITNVIYDIEYKVNKARV